MTSPLTSPGGLVLGELDGRDYDPLFELASVAPLAWPRVSALRQPSLGSFHDALWRGVLLQLVLRPGPGGPPLAVFACYDADPLSQVAWFDVVLVDPEAADELDGATAAVLQRIFTQWPFRKLYTWHSELQPPPLGFLGEAAAEEGRLVERDRYEGRYWDRILTAVDGDRLRRDATGGRGPGGPSW